MNDTKKKMLSIKKWAVYGASPDESKFGYKIPIRMIKHGYDVVGVNSKYKGQQIGDMQVVGSLDEIPDDVECLDIVVNPTIALQVIDEAKKKGINYLWFQPGTWNEEVLEKAEKNGMNIVYDDCVYAILGP